jgi:hypothetical protein
MSEENNTRATVCILEKGAKVVYISARIIGDTLTITARQDDKNGKILNSSNTVFDDFVTEIK